MLTSALMSLAHLSHWRVWSLGLSLSGSTAMVPSAVSGSGTEGAGDEGAAVGGCGGGAGAGGAWRGSANRRARLSCGRGLRDGDRRGRRGWRRLRRVLLDRAQGFGPLLDPRGGADEGLGARLAVA